MVRTWIACAAVCLAIGLIILSYPNVSNAQSYQVRAGDSLYKIAQYHGTSINELRNLNGLRSDTLHIGQTLRVPMGHQGNNPRLRFSEGDLDLLARLVMSEAQGEPYEGQVAAAAVTINRVLDPRFPGTLYEVIYQIEGGAYQYEPVMNGRINQPANATARQAALEALDGADPTGGAIGFYNPDKVRAGNWVRQHPITARIGNHVFFHY